MSLYFDDEPLEEGIEVLPHLFPLIMMINVEVVVEWDEKPLSDKVRMISFNHTKVPADPCSGAIFTRNWC